MHWTVSGFFAQDAVYAMRCTRRWEQNSIYSKPSHAVSCTGYNERRVIGIECRVRVVRHKMASGWLE